MNEDQAFYLAKCMIGMNYLRLAEIKHGNTFHFRNLICVIILMHITRSVHRRKKGGSNVGYFK